MDLVRRLFGQAEQPAPSPAPESASVSFYGDRIVQIEPLGLMGSGTRSPDGSLILACGSIHTGATDKERDGAWAVVRDSAIVVRGRAERPQEGKIADNGVFIFSDWLHRDALCGRFMAFDASGRTIVAQDFDAILYGNGLSNEGRYAICQTARSPGSPDSNIVAAFDLAEGRALARWQPTCGTAREFMFDEEAGLVHLLTHDGDRESYDLATGAMHDRDSWRTRRIKRGDLAVIGELARDGPALDPALLEQIRAGLKVAQANVDGRTGGRGFRIEGELFEALGQPADALAAYEQALKRDPQAGVAKRADKLRSATATGTTPRLSRFAQQAERAGISHEQIVLERGEGKTWRHRDVDPFTPVELAALAHYQREGWSGCAAEGGLILTLLKAATFPKLDSQHADTFVEALYHRAAGWPNAHVDPEQHVANVARADATRIARNWAMISASAGDTPAFYPRVTWPHVEQLFAVLGPARLAEVARIFATAPYDLRAGWPDLTLWRDGQIRFVEVKSPSDQMHASQVRLISTLLVPLGFDTTLAEVKPQR